MALLECRGLVRRPWLDGVDLDVSGGEIVVLCGPSGSGKTLLLRALADLDPCTAGEVRLDGVPREQWTAARWRRSVLYVHPAGACLPGTVAENMARVAAFAVGREARGGRPVDAPPSSPPLDPAADARRLSSGEAQALALVRALACEPQVLLLDEVTAQLDDDAARAWERSLRAWATVGRGILWVSHDRGLAERLGARQMDWP